MNNQTNETVSEAGGKPFTLETIRAVKAKMATFPKLPDYLVEYQGEWVKLYVDGKIEKLHWPKGTVLCSPITFSWFYDEIVPAEVEKFQEQATGLLFAINVVWASEEQRRQLITMLL